MLRSLSHFSGRILCKETMRLRKGKKEKKRKKGKQNRCYDVKVTDERGGDRVL